MKLIPALTLTALAAAASAQTAPAAAPAAKQGLSYNRVIVQVVDGDILPDAFAVTAQAKLGQGFYIKAVGFDGENSNGLGGLVGNDDVAVLGWAYSLPSLAGVNSDLNLELGVEVATVGIRALVASGVEIGINYAEDRSFGDNDLGLGTIQFTTYTVNVSLGQFVKGLSFNADYRDGEGDQSLFLGLGYNF